jgi:hypothetical protein
MVDGPVLYQVAEYIAGARGKGYQVHIPGPGPVDLADLQPVDEPQTVAPYPVPGAAGAPGARGPAGPPGPQGPIGAGIRILSAVPTVGDLPSTGNQPGDAHLVTATGNLHVWDGTGWAEIGHVQGPPGPAGPLDMLTDVTAPAATPPNSLLGTVGEGLTPGRAEWEPLHLDYVQSVVLGPLPSNVADLGQRVTELEHTGEIVPPDLELTVDLYSGSFTRIIGCDPVTAAPPKRITVTLATTPGPNGAIFTDLSGISGTGAVWADFGGTIGKVVDTSGTGINGAALKEAIRRGQIVTVHRGSDGTHPTLVVEKVENPADAGSSLTLDALRDVTAPANTPVGKGLGTTATGAWGPVDFATADAAAAAVGSLGVPRPWTATSYQQYSLVMHAYPTGQMSYWQASAAATAADVPGVAAVWKPLNLSQVGYISDTAVETGNLVTAMLGSKYRVVQWEARGYATGTFVYRADTEGTFELWRADQDTAAADVPGTSPKWTQILLTDDGVPPAPAPAPYTYSQSGVQGAGQTVILQGYFAVHETDKQGVDHDWGTVLHAGDKVTWNGQTYTVASINTGDATLPQVVIDNFVRSGICMVKTVEPVPAAPANGAAVGFGPSPDGQVLTLSGGEPVWQAPAVPPVTESLMASSIVGAPEGGWPVWEAKVWPPKSHVLHHDTDGAWHIYSNPFAQATAGMEPGTASVWVRFDIPAIGDLSWYSEWTGSESWPASGSVPSVTVIHEGVVYTAVAPVTSADVPGSAFQWLPMTMAAMLEQIGNLTARIAALETP